MHYVRQFPFVITIITNNLSCHGKKKLALHTVIAILSKHKLAIAQQGTLLEHARAEGTVAIINMHGLANTQSLPQKEIALVTKPTFQSMP